MADNRTPEEQLRDSANVTFFPPQGNAREDTTATAGVDFLDVGGWQGAPVPRRSWLVENVIPALNVTLLSGEGAIGKSNLLLQLCSATALATDWIGFIPDPGPAIYLGAEDDTDELHRRLDKIAQAVRATFRDLAQNLFIASFAGRDAVLGIADRLGIVKPTPLYLDLIARCRKMRPKVIALDTAADVFVGNENDRSQVRQFVGLMRALALAGHSSVVLAAHPSLTGVHNDSGLSGSTAWHNSVRSRLYLKTATNGDGSHDETMRVLDMRKSNYGPLAKQVALQWNDGVFKPVASGLGQIAQAVADQKADDTFLRILTRYVRDGRNVSDRGGVNFAPKLFALEPDVAADTITQDHLHKAMNRLFAAGRIRMENYGRPSHGHRRMVPMVLF